MTTPIATGASGASFFCAAAQAVALVLVLFVLAVEPVLAQSPGVTQGNRLIQMIQDNLVWIFTVSIMVVGILCAFSILRWMWFVGLVIGAALAFGAAGFVDFLRA